MGASVRPTTTTTIVGPLGVTYTTSADAEAGLKTIKVGETQERKHDPEGPAFD